jgi:nitroimidazol reductase NimA-like FMN-containing flavoprotein (pyridoxamine 5'-phosphate oxidase superfamily)
VRELTIGECEAILRRNTIARLGIRDVESPYIVPISYAYASGVIYGHAPPGKKVALARIWPDVSLLVDEIQAPDVWQSALVRGRWHELTSEEDRVRARMELLRVAGGSLLRATAGHGHKTTLADAILFRVTIGEMTGRAEHL